MNNSIVLSIDFGLKHIGLAIYKNEMILSLPDLKYQNKDDFLLKINKIISDYNVQVLLFGVPPYSPALENTIRNHANSLKAKGRKIVYLNEDLTSKIYEKVELGVSDHSMAAREILSEYLGINI